MKISAIVEIFAFYTTANSVDRQPLLQRAAMLPITPRTPTNREKKRNVRDRGIPKRAPTRKPTAVVSSSPLPSEKETRNWFLRNLQSTNMDVSQPPNFRGERGGEPKRDEEEEKGQKTWESQRENLEEKEGSIGSGLDLIRILVTQTMLA